MKKLITGSIVMLASILATQITKAQGTMTYLSSLTTNVTDGVASGSDSWLAAGFTTGTNAGGYSLDSIQLGMADASGNPTNFMVMIYASTPPHSPAVLPTSSLGALDGSLNPANSGIYTFAAVSNLLLSPHTDYFIVVTAGTTVANGSYNWNESAFPPSSSGSWSADNALLQSGDGSSGWYPTSYLGLGQFAISAEPIPEPGVLGLLGLGGLAFLWHRRKAKAVE